MDEFFAGVEQQQQRLFIEKYAGFNSSIQEYAHSYACLTWTRKEKRKKFEVQIVSSRLYN